MSYTLPLHTITKEDTHLIGTKAASLGELIRFHVNVPEGFVVTTQAMEFFLKENNLKEKVEQELTLLDRDNPESLKKTSYRIKQIVLSTPFPKELINEIFDAYEDLGGVIANPEVAIRTSLTTDTPSSGEHSLFLNIKGEATVGQLVKEVWASQFNPYRLQKLEDLFNQHIAVVVQKMLTAETSGFIHTLDSRSNNKRVFVIEAIWGTGEYLVQHKVEPDRYTVNKDTLEIVTKNIKAQEIQLIKTGEAIKEKYVPSAKQEQQKLTDGKIKELAEIGKKLQKLHFYPQTAEWVVAKNKIYIVQLQQLLETDSKDTILVKNEPPALVQPTSYSLPVLLEGVGVSPGVVSGTVQLIDNPQDINLVDSKDIVVIKELTPEFFPIVRQSKGLITEKDSIGSPAALLARELGIAAIVGVDNATTTLKPNQLITIDGEGGFIYEGKPNLSSKHISYSRDEFKASTPQVPQPSHPPARKGNIKKPRLKTAARILVDLPSGGDPKSIKDVPADGVALIRGEYVFSQLGIHPKKLVADGKTSTVVSALRTTLEDIIRVFPKNDVYYRFSDMQNTHFTKTAGGKDYEIDEANSLLGFRGSFRHLYHKEILEAEIEAVKKVRENFTNLHVVIPLVRSLKEFEEIKAFLADHGLKSTSTLEVWLCASTPANLILTPQLTNLGVDGFMVDLNELACLTLGVDSGNTEVLPLFNEIDQSVIWLLEHSVRYNQRQEKPTVICGKACGQYPHFVDKMVKAGAWGFAVPPDLVEAARRYTASAELKLLDITG
ncbi:MAG: PEP/pyruvate-binding domain-containing protein [Patescibacteria group bacterium]|jgi:pyruvate,water dikinase